MKYHYSHRYAILKHKLQNNNVRISKQCIRVLFFKCGEGYSLLSHYLIVWKFCSISLGIGDKKQLAIKYSSSSSPANLRARTVVNVVV